MCVWAEKVGEEERERKREREEAFQFFLYFSEIHTQVVCLCRRMDEDTNMIVIDTNFARPSMTEDPSTPTNHHPPAIPRPDCSYQARSRSPGRSKPGVRR